MKPVLVLQHLSGDGPAFLATWLRRAGVAFDVIDSQAGQTFPDDLAGYAALAVLGGEMSANDDLPSLRRAEQLILQGVARGVPVIGHCLGGQLMARALGARVVASPAPEIGWQPLQVADSPTAAAWLGEPGPRSVMQWHFEAFELPAGAELLAGSAACPHQAFAFGPHLAMQFHVEIDAEKLDRWSREESPLFLDAVRRCASVQDGTAMREEAAARLAPQQALADRIYRRWLSGVVAD
jgi:GMP synthase-like glutamine amidotransferase